MAHLQANEESPSRTYIDAIAHLQDVTQIYTDSNIADIRAGLIHDSSNGALSSDVVPALEVLGIARAVATRFSGGPHHAQTTKVTWAAAMFLGAVQTRLTHEANARTATSEEGDDLCRTLLLKYLDWVHQNGTFHDDASTGIRTCLCPVTAYLQLILRRTPMTDWAEAAANSSPSPLAFAWAWAREMVGRQTADVAVLVTMGRHVHRQLADVPVKAEEERQLAAIQKRVIFLEQGFWAGVRMVTMDLLTDAVTRLRTSPSASDIYWHERELKEADELLETVQKAAQRLGKAGTQYAGLLGEDQMAQERKAVVDSIRFDVEFILSKTELPGSEAVFPVIRDLAKSE